MYSKEERIRTGAVAGSTVLAAAALCLLCVHCRKETIVK